jgi:hypothetical protein
MLIHDGEQRYLGEPEEAALRYYRLNFAGHSDSEESAVADVPDVNVRLIDVWLEDDQGIRVDNVEQERTFTLNLLVEARHDLAEAVFNFHCLNMDGHWVFAFSKTIEDAGGRPLRVAAGERIRLVAEIENPLVPGRYALECWMSRSRDQGNMAIHIMRLLDFFVFGTHPGAGNVSMRAEVKTAVSPA